MTAPERPLSAPRADPHAGDGGVEVSVLVPAKDEEASIPVLAREIERALDALGRPWECLWIDDGSRDGSRARMLELHRRRMEHQVISFARNYGQSAALGVGFRAAAGRIVITMDADLQNDPADIHRLLARLEQEPGLGMVNGIRAERHDNWIRRMSSRIANGFRNWVTRESVTDVGCSLRVFYRDCVQDIPRIRGMHRFIPSYARMRGYRIAEMPVAHRPRRFGDAKYGVGNRLWVGLADTLGVRWLQSRHVLPRIRESTLPPSTAGLPGDRSATAPAGDGEQSPALHASGTKSN